MVAHQNRELFRCCPQTFGGGRALPAEQSVPNSRRTWSNVSAADRRRPARARPERRSIPRACLDDYLGGRTDRLGRELLFDLRPGTARPGASIAGALRIPAPGSTMDVLDHVRRCCPDLVWLYAGDPGLADELARLIVATGVETVVIDDANHLLYRARKCKNVRVGTGERRSSRRSR